MEMTVTALKPYPKGKGRVSVYLNDKFAFVLYKGELSQYGLEEGVIVDDALYERILNETIILRAKKRAMNLLMNMDRTEADVRQKLRDGGYPEEAVDAAVEYLRSYHYIDDMRYASEYIRFKSSSMSRRQIMMKLTEKGIAKETVEEAFLVSEEESGEDPEETERQLARKLIDKKYPQGVEELDNTQKQKLYAYLYRKGISADSIMSFLKS